MNRRHLILRGSALLLATGVTCPALAQAWPSRNITLVVPFPPGGSNGAPLPTSSPPRSGSP